MSEEFESDCGDDYYCPGCCCHISTPCNHCIEHVLTDENGDPIEKEAPNE